MGELQDEVLASWVTARQDNLAFLRCQLDGCAANRLHLYAERRRRIEPRMGCQYCFGSDEFAYRGPKRSSPASTPAIGGGPTASRQFRRTVIPPLSVNGWMTSIPDRAPKDGDNTVWDYRWALPATVYAITARLTVLRLIRWDPAAILREVGPIQQLHRPSLPTDV